MQLEDAILRLKTAELAAIDWLQSVSPLSARALEIRARFVPLSNGGAGLIYTLTLPSSSTLTRIDLARELEPHGKVRFRQDRELSFGLRVEFFVGPHDCG